MLTGVQCQGCEVFVASTGSDACLATRKQFSHSSSSHSAQADGMWRSAGFQWNGSFLAVSDSSVTLMASLILIFSGDCK